MAIIVYLLINEKEVLKIFKEKNAVFIMLFSILVYAFTLPLSSLAANNNSNENNNVPIDNSEQHERILIESNDKDNNDIKLYDSTDESEQKVIHNIDTKEQVLLIDEDDEYFLIEIEIMKEDQKINLQGYVKLSEIKYSVDDKDTEAPKDNEDESEALPDTNDNSNNYSTNNQNNNYEDEIDKSSGDDNKPDKNLSNNSEEDSNKKEQPEAENKNNLTIMPFSSPENAEKLKGVAKKSPTNVRSTASTSSKIIKQYAIGSVLNYYKYNDNWYTANVYVDGEYTTGFIHKKHVTTIKTIPKSKKVAAKKSPTNIRAGVSTKAKIIKKLPIGDVNNVKTFSANWYQIDISVNGKTQTGYIHKKHATAINTQPKAIKTVAKKSPTNVRAGVSTKAKIIKKLPIGDVNNIKTFSANWYQIDVSVNGKTQTGYIHRKHATVINTKPKSVASLVTQRTPTNVRAGVSTKAKVAKKLPKSKTINLKTFSANWYSYSEGNKIIGYIHKKHVGESTTTNYKQTLSQALNTHYNRLKAYQTKSNIQKYLDPKKNNQTQHMLINHFTSGTEIENILKSVHSGLSASSSLKGQEKAFMNAAKKYSLDVFYLASHARHESGNGMSLLSQGVWVGKNKNGELEYDINNSKKLTNKKKAYNMYGIGAFDSDPMNASIHAYQEGWFTPKAGIEGGAAWISKWYIHNSTEEQNTLYKIIWHPKSPERAWHSYATDPSWPHLIANYMDGYISKQKSPMYRFDFPKYK